MEALHEEIYFNTLHFFDVMGRFTRGAGLAYPGRVIPIVHPKADGKAGRAKISVTGFDAARPSVVVEYVERGGRRGEVRLDIPKIAVDRPQTLAATVRARPRRDRTARSAVEGRHRKGRARRAGQAHCRGARRSHDDVRRAGERRVREPRSAPRARASIVTRSRITTLARSA